MTFVKIILSRLPDLRKPQLTYLLAMFQALFTFFGKANRTNLHRYGAPSPRTQYRWGRRDFDFFAFNHEALREAKVLEHETAGVIDETFVEKAGKETWGVGKFHNGCAGRVEHGMSASVIALVDLDEHLCYPLHARQLPATPQSGTRLDFAVSHYKFVRENLPQEEMIWLADGAYARKKFVDAVRNQGDILVTKLRCDAAMRHRYTGPVKTGPGRKKVYDGKVVYDETSRWRFVAEIESGVLAWTGVFHHTTFECALRVVMLRWQSAEGPKHVLLMSTEPNMDPLTVVELYRARFQIEFVFRRAKQHTGFQDSQVRDKPSIHHHLNLSLAALNVLLIEEVHCANGAISLASVRRRKQNQALINQIFSIFDIDPTRPEIRPHLKELRDYGVIAA